MNTPEWATRPPDAIFNQPPPLEDYNLFEHDTPLREALQREGGGWIEPQAQVFGALLGKAETLRLGELANRYLPVLRTHDRFGHRIDEVEFHPAWHELMRIGIGHNTHVLPWIHPRSGAHVARAAKFYVWRVDAGHGCPISMTYAAVPALRHSPELAATYEPLLSAGAYDPG